MNAPRYNGLRAKPTMPSHALHTTPYGARAAGCVGQPMPGGGNAMRVTLIAVLFLSAFLVPTVTGFSREFHVSVHGNDSNDGTAQRPLRTISAAAQRARPGDVITVHEGVYREHVAPPRGGVSDAERIVYRAAPGERVVIKGSEVVRGWVRVGGSVWKVSLPEEFFGEYNPYRERIEGDWFVDKGRAHHPGEVYIEGRPLWEAATLEDVFARRDGHQWWFAQADEKETTIWADFADADPNRCLVEINVRRTCFYPDRPGVNYITVRGFILQHAATPWSPPTSEQIGLIGTHWSKGWIIENNVISDSRCAGITLGKYHDPRDRREASAEQYNETIRHALEHGWSKENVGSHIVRNNIIFRCEQAGICGSMGGAFSVIEGNHIYSIWTKRLFKGAEIAGIKLHGAVDTLIARNCIHGCGRGIWLDWMAQGARVTANLLYDNDVDDIFLEVNHGPCVVDNNFMLSAISVRNVSEGSAFVHNLLYGALLLHPELHRRTPYLHPHSTRIAGLAVTRGGDDRWYNNLFLGGTGLRPYDRVERPVWMGGNVFFDGARPSRFEATPLVLEQVRPTCRVVSDRGRIFLDIELRKEWLASAATELVTTELLGEAAVPRQRYTRPDGSLLRIDTDYFGHLRPRDNVLPGPLAAWPDGPARLRLWPRR